MAMKSTSHDGKILQVWLNNIFDFWKYPLLNINQCKAPIMRLIDFIQLWMIDYIGECLVMGMLVNGISDRNTRKGFNFILVHVALNNFQKFLLFNSEKPHEFKKFYLNVFSSTDLIKGSCNETGLFESRIKCMKG